MLGDDSPRQQVPGKLHHLMATLSQRKVLALYHESLKPNHRHHSASNHSETNDAASNPLVLGRIPPYQERRAKDKPRGSMQEVTYTLRTCFVQLRVELPCFP